MDQVEFHRHSRISFQGGFTAPNASAAEMAVSPTCSPATTPTLRHPPAPHIPRIRDVRSVSLANHARMSSGIESDEVVLDGAAPSSQAPGGVLGHHVRLVPHSAR